MAPSNRQPLGRPIQLLYQRPAMFRICPYLPFSARACLNQHHWLGNRMREEGIDFKQCANAFTRCAKPKRLQQLANSLTPWDLLRCGQKWLARLTPFFTAGAAGIRLPASTHLSQVELCDNLIFQRRTALDKLGERLLDANRTIGQPNKITVIFGRRISKHYRGKLQTKIEDMDLPLWQWLRQAVRSRSPHAAHRGGGQQRLAKHQPTG